MGLRPLLRADDFHRDQKSEIMEWRRHSNRDKIEPWRGVPNPKRVQFLHFLDESAQKSTLGLALRTGKVTKTATTTDYKKCKSQNMYTALNEEDAAKDAGTFSLDGCHVSYIPFPLVSSSISKTRNSKAKAKHSQW
jgi:hypothetical protein